jgi:putative membrane protein
VLLVAPLAAIDGWLDFRDTGWAIDRAGRLVLRRGGFSRATTIVPRGRIQRRWIDQNPLQRRAALASFGGAIASGGAGGRLRLEHLDVDVAGQLLDQLDPTPRSAPDADLRAGAG